MPETDHSLAIDAEIKTERCDFSIPPVCWRGQEYVYSNAFFVVWFYDVTIRIYLYLIS